MSWAEKRIKQYKEGEKPTALEKMALEHGHPVNCVGQHYCLCTFGIRPMDA